MNREALEALTTDELLTLNQALMNEKEKIRQQQLEINQVLTARAVRAKAEKTAGSLSEAEKAALLQVIQPIGISSAEEFGAPAS
jgi:hypothetical protein